MRQSKILSFIFLTFFVFATFAPMSGMATEVWSDDFTDGNMDGWTIWNGTWTVQDNALYVPNDDVKNHIWCDCNLLSGTWSFDIYRTSNFGNIFIGFVGNESYINYTYHAVYYQDEGYRLEIHAADLILYYRVHHMQAAIYPISGGTNNLLAEYNSPTNFSSSMHIDITVETGPSSAEICVYLDGVLRIWKTSLIYFEEAEYFWLRGYEGDSFDNFVVSDSIDITNPNATETTTTTTDDTTETTTPTDSGDAPAPLPLELLAVAGAIAVVVVLIVVWRLKR